MSKRSVYQLRMTEEQRAFMEKLARDRDMSMAALIRHGLNLVAKESRGMAPIRKDGEVEI